MHAGTGTCTRTRAQQQLLHMQFMQSILFHSLLFFCSQRLSDLTHADKDGQADRRMRLYTQARAAHQHARVRTQVHTHTHTRHTHRLN